MLNDDVHLSNTQGVRNHREREMLLFIIAAGKEARRWFIYRLHNGAFRELTVQRSGLLIEEGTSTASIRGEAGQAAEFLDICNALSVDRSISTYNITLTLCCY